MECAIVLLSGGLDSATVAAIARAEGFEVCALTLSYGQRHEVEVAAAARVADSLGICDRVTITINLRAIGGSALTADLPVPKTDPESHDERNESEIPITYVPARNTIFLSYALALAEVRGAGDIFIGANAVDYSGYPDCRPVFIEKFEELANVATKAGVEGRRIRIHAPLMQLSKCQIIRRGVELGVDYGLTHSCYDPDETGAACGGCESCRLRRAGFEAADLPDPTRYMADVTHAGEK